MKIYTYYEPLNDLINNKHEFHDQETLLELWKQSWQQAGFEPCIVNLKDAQNSPLFETLSDKMTYFFNRITGKTLSSYGLHCFLRWLAYSTIDNSDELFLVSDYDVINNNSNVEDWKFNKGNLTFLQGCCPCLASGSSRHFEVLCKGFLEVTEDRLSFLIKNANHYHDQEFLVFNFNSNHNKHHKQLCSKYNMKIDRDYAPTYKGGDSQVKAFHIPHSAARQLKTLVEYNHLDNLDSVRIEAAKKILSNFKHKHE